MPEMTKDDLIAMMKEIVGEQRVEMMAEMQKASVGQMPALIRDAIASSKDQDNKKGSVFGTCVRALANAKGDVHRAAELAQKWDHDAATKALSASDGSAGGFVVPEGMLNEVVELLRPASVVLRAQPRMVDMPNGNLTLPGLASGASSSYQGENTDASASQPSYRDIVFTARKLVSLVPVSNDLTRFASVNNDAIVRDDMVQSMGTRQDVAFIRGDGSENTPKGMRNLLAAANIVTANGTINLANVTFDLGQLVLKLKSSNCRFLRPVWFLSPRTELYLMTVRDGNGNYAFRDEMLTGNLWTYQFFVTNNIPENLGSGTDESEIYLADMADCVVADAQRLTVDVSTDASYIDSTSGTLVSAFSRDQTVMRAIMEHDFNLRHADCVAVLTEVKWAPTGS